MLNVDKEIDLTGLTCPLPILRTKAALVGMASGEVLKVTFTNPDSVKELKTYAEQTANRLVETDIVDGKYVYWIERG